MNADRPTTARSALVLGALGVVFGDIGTSPLYALRETVRAAGGAASAEAVLGSVSLVVWALLVSVTLVYVNVILRVNNRGEGGILSLAALIGLHKTGTRRGRRLLLGIALVGSAALFGDAVITPAISVLSAVEGLQVAVPALDPLVVPIAIVILLAFFAAQMFGTARIGLVFGPVMAVWFLVLSALGVRGIASEPAILSALDPRHAVAALANGPDGATVVLASLFLAITGGEALYADLGQFGRKAIARAWYLLALPALVLVYLGQGALLLHRPDAFEDPFFTLAPQPLRLPLVILATAATIIASQAVVTGVFTIARQAGQLGVLPPLRVRHTSGTNEHQIYIGLVNVIVGVLAVVVVWGFGSSDALANAYGLAVAFAMLATSTLFAATLRLVYRWSWARLVPLAALVVGLDVVFVTANLSKIATGGWLPALLAGAALLVMVAWTRGRTRVRGTEDDEPVGHFLHRTARGHHVLAHTGVFLAAPGRGTPTALLRLERLFDVTLRDLIIVTVWVRSTPHVPSYERVTHVRLDPHTVRVDVSTGFMQGTDLPSLLGPTFKSLKLASDDVVYVTGRDRIDLRRRHASLRSLPGRALDKLFVFLTRNAERTTDRFNLPPKRTIEIGSVQRLADR